MTTEKVRTLCNWRGLSFVSKRYPGRVRPGDQGGKKSDEFISNLWKGTKKFLYDRESTMSNSMVGVDEKSHGKLTRDHEVRTNKR